jgi:hypothetical protein
MKNIINRNSKGEYHGYQEWYWKDNTLRNRGNCNNGKLIGYSEYHVIKQTIFNII